MEQLAQYDAKATFFCVGENVRQYPEVFDQLITEGHTVGNHSLNHLNGWVTDNIPYFHNVRHGAHLTNSLLFRPPYGKLRPRQSQFLLRHYRIIMWDVLSGDFDPTISNEQCLNNVIGNANEGSIVVLHDSIKSEEKLRYILPRILEHYTALGYKFEALAPKLMNTGGRKMLEMA